MPWPRERPSQVTKKGGDTWFFLTSDYAFGHSLQENATYFVEESGGKVIGSVRFPFGSSDFSSFLLQAQAAKAKSSAWRCPARTSSLP
jgi:branched-chain amino acid transport system substrate-binding protein